MVPDRAGDYSAWMRDAIKDEDLAAEFAAVERDRELSADDSRARIKAAIDRRYTGPAAEGPPGRQSGIARPGSAGDLRLVRSFAPRPAFEPERRVPGPTARARREPEQGREQPERPQHH
jgi:hypothetical protein